MKKSEENSLRLLQEMCKDILEQGVCIEGVWYWSKYITKLHWWGDARNGKIRSVLVQEEILGLVVVTRDTVLKNNSLEAVAPLKKRPVHLYSHQDSEWLRLLASNEEAGVELLSRVRTVPVED